MTRPIIHGCGVQLYVHVPAVSKVTEAVPPPPEIPDTVARLVHSNIGLAELFETRAIKQHMVAEPVDLNELTDTMAAYLRERKCRRVMLSDTPLLRKLEVGDQLDERGFEARYWSGITADGAYDYDAGVTEVEPFDNVPQAVQAARKPCLVYKVLAAGRRVGSPAEVRSCFETALKNIKPTDAVIDR